MESKSLLAIDCNRQFVLEPTNCISQQQKDLIDKLLLEKIPLWQKQELLGFGNIGYQMTLTKNIIRFQKRLILFLKKVKLLSNVMKCGLCVKITNNGFGLLLILKLSFMVGAYIGSRDIEGAKGLWDSLPPVYRQCAVSYTHKSPR